MIARSLQMLIAAGLLFAGVSSAWAQSDFFQSSPGALSRSHAAQDGQSNCNLCHDGGRTTNDRKCLGCHEHSDLRRRIAAGKGWHAAPEVKRRKCEYCHLEHKGRGFDIMGWRQVAGGMRKFDHRKAGWPLEGKHATTRCEECHKTRNSQGLRTFLGTNPVCGSCHKNDQPHGFKKQAFMRCERCHNEIRWRPPLAVQDFDHNKRSEVEMPLLGSHEQVSCKKCHAGAKFNLGNKDPDACSNCHQSPHKGHLFGKKNCSWCHSPTLRKLDRIRFNHSKRTRFELAGAHGKLGCYDCHTKKLGTKRPDRNCETCHTDDDRHRGRFKQFGTPNPRCRYCHPSSSWKPSVFDHNKRTKFSLTGKHARVDCRSCHRGSAPHKFERFVAKKVQCMGCHQHANAHDGEYKKLHDRKGARSCINKGCHRRAGDISVDEKVQRRLHATKYNFPLVRGHRNVKCVSCHFRNEKYRDAPRECGERCHADSLHNGSLGDKCSRCHAVGSWDARKFDHTEDTSYPLEGLHKTAPSCEDCHPQQQYKPTPTTCSAQGCHAADDVHKDKLGSKCDRCHLVTGENLFNHNTMSDYPLDGKHLEVRCSECHPSITFKPRPTDCYGDGACHTEPAVHKGRYGTLCEDCHTTATFKNIRPMHDVGDFSLTGSHNQLDCSRCHNNNRPLAGSGNLCMSCHRTDDVHNNGLSPRCGGCHTQWSFAPARFDHTTVGCTLTGLHRSMACNDCHQAGNYGAVNPQCVGCHRDTAVRKGGDHLAYTTCAGCHNPNSWSPPVAYGRESVCR